MSDIDLSMEFKLSNGWYNLSESSTTFVTEGSPISPGAIFGPGSSTSGSISFNDTVNTGGPVRQGYLYVQAGGGFGNAYNATQTLSFGFSNLAVVSYDAMSGGFTPGPTSPLQTTALPVMLGTDLNLFLAMSTYDYAAPGDGFSGSTGSASYQFRLTELDGTPALLAQTPEPAAWGSIGTGLTAVAILRARRRKQRV